MPRIVTLVALIAALAAANRYTPGLVQMVLALTVLYLAATHSARLGSVFAARSSDLAHAFRTSPPAATSSPVSTAGRL